MMFKVLDEVLLTTDRYDYYGACQGDRGVVQYIHHDNQFIDVMFSAKTLTVEQHEIVVVEEKTPLSGTNHDPGKMAVFNLRDKVRCVEVGVTNLHENKIYTIVGIDVSNRVVCLTEGDTPVHGGPYSVERFELVCEEKRTVGGTKHDTDKIRMELLPPFALKEIARVLTFGAKKYNSWNWTKGFDYSRLIGACERHLADWKSGIDKDLETGLSHLAHLGCCVLFLIWMEKHRPDLDDRFKDPAPTTKTT